MVKNERVDRELGGTFWYCQDGTHEHVIYCVSKAQARRISLQAEGWMPDMVVEATGEQWKQAVAGKIKVIYP